MLKLVCCVDIKSGDKFECDRANVYEDRFLFVEENGRYHTYRIDKRTAIDDLFIVDCEERRFYFKEELEICK